LMAVDY